MWKAADKNGDGLLDSAEFQAFSNPEEHPDMLPLILNQTLRNKDTDNDGSISFQVKTYLVLLYHYRQFVIIVDFRNILVTEVPN